MKPITRTWLSHTSIATLTAAALLFSASGNAQLSISKDQQTSAPQLQSGIPKSGGDSVSGSDGNSSGGSNPQLSTTKIQIPQTVLSNMDVQNSHLDDVDANASVIFEVPVDIDTDGTYPDVYDNHVQVQGGLADKTVERFGMHCYIKTEDVYYTPGNTKVIHLNSDGDFQGTVRIGVPIKGDNPLQNPDGTRREWQCFIAPIHERYMLPTSIVGGGAYNEREKGNL